MQAGNCPTRPFARLLPILMLTACLAACGGGDEASEPAFPPTPVGVATVKQREVVETRQFSGRIQAVSNVALRPRVAGYLTEVHFEEGAIVEEGALLFSIDQREYQANFAAAEADVQRARSRLEIANIEFERNQRLIKQNAVSQGRLDAARAEQQQATADLALAQARRDEAALDVEFTRIRAPFRGRTGEARVRIGNLVAPDATLLTTLVSVDPVRVRFEPDEQTFLSLQAEGGNGAPLVEVAVGTDGEFSYRARLAFLDNIVDAASGTIDAWAVLDNADGRLTPGLFARVRVPVRTLSDAILIDERAILTDQDRKYVYVVGEGSVAERRDITLGPQLEDQRVVQSGLDDGDQVVVSGMRKIFYPGAPIAPKEIDRQAQARAMTADAEGGTER